MDEKAVSRAVVAAPPLLDPGLLSELAAVWAFAAVEAAAELLRRHMVAATNGPLSSAPAALVAMSLWTYLAHTRYAFRSSTRTGLSTLPPYVVLYLGVAVAESWLGRGAALLGQAGLVAAATLLKFRLLRVGLWPVGQGRNAQVRQPHAR